MRSSGGVENFNDESYLSSAQIYAGFFASARKSFNEFTSPIDNCNKFA
jgi:hypothetical protein